MINPLIVEIDYTNHNGERRKRQVQPTSQMMFASNQWHPEPQWLFVAVDLEDPHQTAKTFALAGLHHADEEQHALTSAELLRRLHVVETQLVVANEELNDKLKTEAELNAQIDALKDELADLRASLVQKSPKGATKA